MQINIHLQFLRGNWINRHAHEINLRQKHKHNANNRPQDYSISRERTRAASPWILYVLHKIEQS